MADIAQPSVSQTASVALGTAGGAEVLMWLFKCLESHALITPDQGTAMVMVAALAPFCHAIGKLFIGTVEKHTGIDINGDGKTAVSVEVTQSGATQ